MIDTETFKWLKRRNSYINKDYNKYDTFCYYCKDKLCISCPTDDTLNLFYTKKFIDALEFSEIVINILSKNDTWNKACCMYYLGCMHDCAECCKKYAYIKAEEELNDISKSF